MKKLLLILLLCPLFGTVAHAEDVYEQTAQMAQIYEVENALSDEELALTGNLTLDGSYDTEGALRRLWKHLLASLQEQLQNNLLYAAQLVALAALCAVLRAATPHKTISGFVDMAACCAATLMLSGSLESVIVQATETLRQLSDYSRAALPAIFTAAAFTGAVGSAAARYAAVCLAMDVMMTAQMRLVLPLLYGFLTVSISRSLFDNAILAACARFLKWSITMALTTVTLVFSAYLSITGAIAGSTDAVAIKATRTAIATALPVVGGILSDSASVILAAAGFIKNTAGAFALLAVCALCLGPFALLTVKMLLFKLAAAVADMFPASGLSRLIGDFSVVFGILLGMIGSCGIMLFLSIMSGIKVVAAG